jgi:opacity protein-like surface antigen
MTKMRATWLVAILALCAPSAVSAEKAPSPYSGQGIQLALGAHYAIEDFSRGEVLDAEGTAGGNVRLGFRLHRNLSVDANVDFNPSFDATFHGDTSYDTVETIAFTAAARGILPFGRFEPYLSLGFGLIVVDHKAPKSEKVDGAARFEGGIDIHITEAIGVNLRAGYMLPISHLNGFKHAMAGAGLFYRFNVY